MTRLGWQRRWEGEMDDHKTLVGPEVSWDCPSCGERVTTRRLVGWDSLDAAWAEAEAALPEGRHSTFAGWRVLWV